MKRVTIKNHLWIIPYKDYIYNNIWIIPYWIIWNIPTISNDNNHHHTGANNYFIYGQTETPYHPHRRNRNAANNIFISEQAEQQPRILNITSTAQNETPFALSLSLQFWNKQNTGAYKTPSNYFYRKEQHNLPPNKRTCSRKEIKRLTSRWRYNTIQRADYYNRPLPHRRK